VLPVMLRWMQPPKHSAPPLDEPTLEPTGTR
jgi:hypothetical protein